MPSSSSPRNWSWLFAVVAALALAAVWFAFRAKPMYEAQSTIELRAPEAGLEGQIQLLVSDGLLMKAAKKAGLTPIDGTQLDTARKRLSVTLDGSQRFVQIVASSAIPKESASLVNSLVDAFIDEIRKKEAGAVALRQGRIDEVHAQLEDMATQIINFQADNQRAPKADSEQRHEILTEKMAALQETYDKMLDEEPQSTKPWIVKRALVPSQPMNSSPWWDLGFGGALVLGGGLLFLFSRRRATSPDAAAQPAAEDEPLSETPASEEPEAQEEAGAPDSRIVALSNIGARPASSEPLLNYVETLIAKGGTVLIVDCETTAVLTEATGLTGAAGLSDFLNGEAETFGERGSTWKSTWENIYIMPAGKDPQRIPWLLSRPNAGEALASLGTGFGYVVINAPSILTAGEMRDLTPQIDGIVLVTPAERSAGLTNAAVRQVEEYGGKVLGWVEEGVLERQTANA